MFCRGTLILALASVASFATATVIDFEDLAYTGPSTYLPILTVTPRKDTFSTAQLPGAVDVFAVISTTAVNFYTGSTTLGVNMAGDAVKVSRIDGARTTCFRLTCATSIGPRDAGYRVHWQARRQQHDHQYVLAD